MGSPLTSPYRLRRVSPAALTAVTLLVNNGAFAQTLADGRLIPVSADAGQVSQGISVLSVVLNGSAPDGVAYVVRGPGGKLWVDRDTLDRLRIRYDDAPMQEFDGRTMAQLSALRGVTWSISEEDQRLELHVDPNRLPRSTLSYGLLPPIMARTPDFGGFLNYTIYGNTTNSYGGLNESSASVSGLFEAVAFGPYGSVGVTTLVNPVTTPGSAQPDVVVLDAAWRWDDPARLRTLIVGDAITAPGWWGNAVRFGGVQYSSNFSLQPGFITYPLLTVSGVAAIPTAAELYANNVRLGSQNVPPGPFSITNVPVVNGAGELQLVVTNALGQQQVITQPYYTTTQLLRSGLSEFSFSAGAVRFNYGLENFDYRDPLASGVYRYGLTDKLTLEGRAEGSSDVRGAGVGAATVLGVLGTLQAGVAGSDSSLGNGGRALLGFDRQTPTISFGVRGTWASPDYREVGDGGVQTARSISANLNVQLPGQAGTMAFLWTDQRFRNVAPVNTSTAPPMGALDLYAVTYTKQLGTWGAFTLVLSRTTGLTDQTQVQALFTVPLGTGVSGTASALNTQSNGQRTTVGALDVQRPLQVGPGYGYYVHAQTDDQGAAGISYQGLYGRYSLEGSVANSTVGLRATVAGGVGVLDTKVFAAAPIDSSFALVRVSDIPGVRVMQENVEVGRTGDDGTLLVPRIPANVPVKISIDPLTIPFDYSLSGVDQLVITLARTGVVARFESRRENNALVRLMQPDGTPVPEGAEVVVAGRDERFPVAFDGEVFLTDFQGKHEVEVSYNGRRCTVTVEVDPKAPVVAEVGPLVCKLKEAEH
ncbi:MAG TPA: fimbria/pilus outer membrane usher protein [Burkholderiales bacterium]|nr:fimbria/pilus outer membrane usher protein [Burkholderiales bacterium]